ncbi:YbaK/EbsC family protein [Vibrio profundum]|uniref:aminoacyl-tRNA deacylase n=1 Tax=Vibrio profundum TaxID=2910247 RepID=UPI003D0C4C69
MTIAARVDRYFHQNNIDYQIISHRHSTDSFSSASTSRVPVNQLAKAVILQDHQGKRLMAVLPADKKISMRVLNDTYNAKYQLMREDEIYKTFGDCEHGAVPPLGSAYNMMMACDELLDDLNQVYLEAGDHETLLRIERSAFQSIMAQARHLRFGKEMFH